MGRIWRAALSFLGVTLLVVCLGEPSLAALRSENRAVAAAVDSAPGDERSGTTRRTGLGIQFHGTWGDYTDAQRAEVLDRIRSSGATWVRMDVGWSMIQPHEGSFDLGWGVPLVERAIDQVHRAGLKLLVTFWFTPRWANGVDDTRTPPRDPRDYAAAIGWAAQRWGSVVDAWEIWNEPNSSSFFRGADPSTYADLLCAAYDSVHRNDSTSQVVFGGTQYNDDAWIAQAYQAGAKGCFDVMATHPYLGPSDAPPGTPDDGHIYTLRHVRAVRAVMRRFDDRSPIWATEYGWSAHANTGGEDPWERGVTSREQARYAVRALQIFKRDYPYVRKAFWYNEWSTATGDPQQDGYGMLRRDLSPKPVYRAFRSYLG